MPWFMKPKKRQRLAIDWASAWEREKVNEYLTRNGQSAEESVRTILREAYRAHQTIMEGRTQIDIDQFRRVLQ